MFKRSINISFIMFAISAESNRMRVHVLIEIIDSVWGLNLSYKFVLLNLIYINL